MADYTCSNCGGYREHEWDCPSGGTVAVNMHKAYDAVNKEIEEYWTHQKIAGLHYSLAGVKRAVNRAFNRGGESERKM